MIIYFACSGNAYGGSARKRQVKQVQEDLYGYHPGGDFTMELDLSNRKFIMEIDGETIIIDENIGDFQYSPIVLIFDDLISDSQSDIILL